MMVCGIATGLNVRLTGGEGAMLIKKYSIDPAALFRLDRVGYPP